MNNPFSEVETESVEYVAGFIANKFCVKYPDLIQEISSIQENFQWTQFISKGNLKIPSNNLLQAAKQIEIDFKELHGNFLNNEPNIFKKLTSTVMGKINNIPEEVIQCFVRTRTYIRINNLNKDILHKQYTKTSKLKIKILPNKLEIITLDLLIFFLNS